MAGFDFTFSVPKSVSVLWGVADADLQTMIVEAHHAAVTEVVDYLEREVAATRTGVANHNGAVAQVGVAGVIAAAFDHYDSRAGDPQLHTHVVIANKALARLDGRWRSLDSRAVHAAVTAISAHYNAVLADRLTGTFGFSWEPRDRGADRNPQWEIADVPENLISEFSSRTRAIEQEKDRLIDEYVTTHGRRPSNATIVKLRAQATLATRPEKQVRSLADLTGEWRQRAHRLLDGEPAPWARSIASDGVPEALDVDSISLDRIPHVAAQVVDEVSTKRSTWRHWNLWASASKQTMGWRFRTAADREAVVDMIVQTAEQQSVALTPPELAMSPTDFQRDDGTSVFRPRHSTVYSSTQVMAAEDRLLTRANDKTPATLTAEDIERITRREVACGRLSSEQAAAVGAVATSSRQLDLLVGPAGTGKTTAMQALRKAWTAAHGPESVVGLAPSAAAAKALAEDLGIACDNTAKWLHDHNTGATALRRGQLVILDEASLADTRTLDGVTGLAAVAGAKVLLVGDDAQLQSVQAGGAFSMLVHARTIVPELTEIHRFTHDWEKQASRDLRDGRVEVIGTYLRHDRIRDGTTDEMLDAAYAAWREDIRQGRDSVLVTKATRSMHELNARARAERILTNDGEGGIAREVELATGSRASVGDTVITRKNDRRLRALSGGWVRNGDRWVVRDVRNDGSITVHRTGRRLAASVVLPPEYVAQNVDLGYAITAHRAQGITVDTAHVVVTSATTRENLYVSMTRGRDSNTAYVALDQPDETHETPEPEDTTARTVLYGVLRHTGSEISAHQTIATEQETWSSIAQLAAEYETIAAAAQRDRWSTLLRCSGLAPSQADAAINGGSFGPFCSALRRAEAMGHDVDELLLRLVARRSLDDAHDVGAVLQKRLQFAATPRTQERPHLIAGLIPEALGPMTSDHRDALDQRRDLIECRATALAEEAVRRGAPWTRRLGKPPDDPTGYGQWMREVAVVAAYRDRYQFDGPLPVGAAPNTEVQRWEAQIARAAVRRAAAQHREDNGLPAVRPAAGASSRGSTDANPSALIHSHEPPLTRD